MTMKLLNISGEPREYSENGYVYEFPFPAKEPTQVPKEIGEKLLETGQYKEEGKAQPKKEEKEKPKEVEEDAI